jgi:hypothetical protein
VTLSLKNLFIPGGIRRHASHLAELLPEFRWPYRLYITKNRTINVGNMARLEDGELSDHMGSFEELHCLSVT